MSDIKKKTGLILILIMCLVALILAATAGCGQKKGLEGNRPSVSQEQGKQKNPKPHPPFATSKDLSIILSRTGEMAEIEGKIRALVLPHHLVAGHLTAEVLQALAVQNPATVIIIGPNHPNRGAPVITGFGHWETPGGLVETDREIARDLINKGLAAEDDQTLDSEHSVGALVSLLGHFLPEAKVVPLVLHQNVALQEIECLREALGPYLEEGAVLIGSVDFSHYLKLEEANARDAVTLKAIESLDFTALYNMGNDHLDSPASLCMVLKEAQAPGRKLQVLRHSNSALILKNDSIETTSYFLLAVTE